MSLAGSLKLLAGYKAWANEAMFSTLKNSADIEAAEDFKKIIGTLNHVYVVDRIFQAHLQGLPHGYTAVNTVEQPTLSELSAATTAVDQWYVDYVESATDDDLNCKVDFKYTNGEEACLSRSGMIFHVINHGTYHHGQVGVLMSQNSVPPFRELMTHYFRETTT